MYSKHCARHHDTYMNDVAFPFKDLIVGEGWWQRSLNSTIYYDNCKHRMFSEHANGSSCQIGEA